jgi:hypothetical protein
VAEIQRSRELGTRGVEVQKIGCFKSRVARLRRGSEPSIRGGQVAEIQRSRELGTHEVRAQSLDALSREASEVARGCEPSIWGGQVAEIEEISRTREFAG